MSGKHFAHLGTAAAAAAAQSTAPAERRHSHHERIVFYYPHAATNTTRQAETDHGSSLGKGGRIGRQGWHCRSVRHGSQCRGAHVDSNRRTCKVPTSTVVHCNTMHNTIRIRWVDATRSTKIENLFVCNIVIFVLGPRHLPCECDSMDWAHDSICCHFVDTHTLMRVTGELSIPHGHHLSRGHAHLVRRRGPSALLPRGRTRTDSRPPVPLWRYRGQYRHAHAVGFHGIDAKFKHWH
jgi:hypothetical protein